jgi:hypothetical protein
VSLLTAFGLFAITFMLVCYLLEERAAGWTLAFAGGCILSSAYGFLQGAWPFGIVEAIWTVAALRNWRRRLRTTVSSASRAASSNRSETGSPQEFIP